MTVSWVASYFVVMMPSFLPISSSCGGLWCATGEKLTQAVNLKGALNLQRHRKSGFVFLFLFCLVVLRVFFASCFCLFLCSVCCFGFNIGQFNCHVFSGVQHRRGCCDQAVSVVLAEHGGRKGEARAILC